MHAPGSVIVMVSGKVVARQSYEAGAAAPIVLEGFGEHLRTGENEVKVLHDGKGALPYTVAISYRHEAPRLRA